MTRDRLFWPALGQAMRAAGAPTAGVATSEAMAWAAAHPAELATQVRSIKDQYLMDGEAVAKFVANEAAAQH